MCPRLLKFVDKHIYLKHKGIIHEGNGGWKFIDFDIEVPETIWMRARKNWISIGDGCTYWKYGI